MSLTLEDILSPARYVTRVAVKSLKGDVHLRPMSGKERERLNKAHKDKEIDGIGLAKESIRLCVCDEKGTLLFHDLDEIERLPGVVQDELSEQVAIINGFGDEAEAQAEKNSEPTRADLIGITSLNGSGCPSPDVSEKLTAQSSSTG